MFVPLWVWNYIIKSFQSLKIYRIFLIIDSTWSKNTYLNVQSTVHWRSVLFSCCLFPVVLSSFPLLTGCDIYGNVMPLYDLCYFHVQAEEIFLYQEFFFSWTWNLHICISLNYISSDGTWRSKDILFEKRCLSKLCPYIINHGIGLLD